MQSKYGSAEGSALASSDPCHSLPANAKAILMKPRGVFTKGHPIRMNIVPMFLNVFAPWGVWIYCVSVSGFKLRYTYPLLTSSLLSLAFCLWVGQCSVAYWARKKLPDPTWLTYSAVIVMVALLHGTYYGNMLYRDYFERYYEMNDMKVIAHMDVDKELGKTYMDGGIFYFADGNHINVQQAWHFTHATDYCVAPIVGSAGAPTSGMYDFWAVGKDCCSTTSADFRCGDFGNPNARSGWRVLDQEALQFYTLAVEQAETMYGIKSQFPVFVHWSRDPLDELLTLLDSGEQWERVGLWSFFTFCVCMVAFVSFCFGWLGRIPPLMDTYAMLEEEQDPFADAHSLGQDARAGQRE